MPSPSSLLVSVAHFLWQARNLVALPFLRLQNTSPYFLKVPIHEVSA